MATVVVKADLTQAEAAFEAFVKRVEGRSPSFAIPLTTGGAVGASTGGTSQPPVNTVGPATVMPTSIGGVSVASTGAGPIPTTTGGIGGGGFGGYASAVGGGGTASGAGAQQAAAAVQQVVATFNAQATAAVQQAAQQYAAAMGGGYSGMARMGGAGSAPLSAGGTIAQPGYGFGPMNAGLSAGPIGDVGDVGGAGGGAAQQGMLARYGGAFLNRFAGPYVGGAALIEMSHLSRRGRLAEAETGSASSVAEYLRGQSGEIEATTGGPISSMVGMAMDLTSASPTEAAIALRARASTAERRDRTATTSFDTQLAAEARDDYNAAFSRGGTYAADRTAARDAISSRYSRERARIGQQIQGEEAVNTAVALRSNTPTWTLRHGYQRTPGLTPDEMAQYQARAGGIEAMRAQREGLGAQEEFEQTNLERGESYRRENAIGGMRSEGRRYASEAAALGVNRFDRAEYAAARRLADLRSDNAGQELRDLRQGRGSPDERAQRVRVNMESESAASARYVEAQAQRNIEVSTTNIGSEAQRRSTRLGSMGLGLESELAVLQGRRDALSVPGATDPRELPGRLSAVDAQIESARDTDTRERDMRARQFRIGQRNRLSSNAQTDRLLARDPLGAQIIGIQAETQNQLDAADELGFSPRIMARMTSGMGGIARESLARQQFGDRLAIAETHLAFGNASLRIENSRQGTPTERRLRGAATEALGRTYLDAVEAANAGHGALVPRIFERGREELKGEQTRYLESFHAQEANLSRTATTADPAKALGDLAAALKKLEKVPSVDDLRQIVRDAVKEIDQAR